MLTYLIRRVFGSKSDRDMKRMAPVVEQINALEPGLQKLSDDDLRGKTDEFRSRVAGGETLDDLLPEAFAVVREASHRSIGLRHFDVQLLGGMVLHQGKISEMKTGEGKTLVATLAVYLNSLMQQGVHVVTVNDYLAKRDSEWMGPVYRALGLTVGLVQHDLPNEARHAAYRCDVTYVTNNEIGFDYLRDNMVVRPEDRVLRVPLNYAIVDEVDSILIDEARTPLIISGPAEESTEKYYIINRVIPHLKGRVVTESEEIDAKHEGVDLEIGYDFLVDEKAHSATLTDEGVTKCERLLGVENLYDDIQSEWIHHINQALRAHNLFEKDVDYVVKDGEVIIVDEFTGRLMPGRRWSDGLHQAVEAKENLRIAEENQTLATITFQNFFRIYKKLAGMTGTAMTEAPEFWEIYKLDVVEIPTNRVMIRADSPDLVYKTEREKFGAVVEEIKSLHERGQPVLVGTRSIEKSETLSTLLRKAGVPHNVLNAKYHEQEAQIIAQAGRKRAVTIATNMAGRGTDIVLGGNPPDAAQAEEVKVAGGLHILGTERHESRRIDNQLRGRAGRQGDPGSSRFYLALNDELMRLFGSDRITPLMEKLGMQEGEMIEHPLVTRAIESAQRKVEAMNFEIRKTLLDYDNVMNKQREVVYAKRNQILDTPDLSETVRDLLTELLEAQLDESAPEKEHPERWDLPTLTQWMQKMFDLDPGLTIEKVVTLTRGQLQTMLEDKIRAAYAEREQAVGVELMRSLERFVMLQVLDACWKDHLYNLDQLRKGIGMRAYGQKDPKVEYQKESYNLFLALIDRITEETAEYLFRVRAPERPRPMLRRATEIPLAVGAGARASGRVGATSRSPAVSRNNGGQGGEPVAAGLPSKLGRNDPCPCGSGKKYKKCHGV